MLGKTLISAPGVLMRSSFNASKASSATNMISSAHFSTRGGKWRPNKEVVRDPQNSVAKPDFHNLLRALYRKSHPDLLRASHPEFAEVNDSSMQMLNGILSTIKKYNEYPAQIVKTIPFHVKKGDQLELVNLKIRTAGGECRKALTVSFKEFFREAEITSKETGFAFNWGKDYFPTSETVNDDEEEKK